MSDTILVEDRLRDTYHAVTTRTDYSVAPAFVPDATSMPVPVHRRRRPVVALVGVALVVALVLGVLAFVQRNDSSTPRPTTPPVDTGPIFPPVQTHVGPELYLAPSDVPVGYSLIRGETNGSSASFGSPEGGTFQTWVELDETGKPLSAFQLSWRPTNSSTYGPVEPIFIGDHAASWSEEGQAVIWEEDRHTVFVGAMQDGPLGTWPEHLTRAEVEGIAARVVNEGGGRFALVDPPGEYRPAGEAPFMMHTGDNVRLLVWAGGSGRGFSVQMVDNADVPPGLALQNSAAQLVQARGLPAVLTPQLNGGDGSGCGPIDLFRCEGGPEDLSVPEDMQRHRCSTAEPGSARFLQWLEPDGTRVTITTVGMGDEAPFTIAKSLREVSRADFDATVATTPTLAQAIQSPFACKVEAP